MENDRHRITAGRDRRASEQVLYDNEWMYKPRFTPMELQEHFDSSIPQPWNSEIRSETLRRSYQRVWRKKSYQNHPEHGIIYIQ